MTPSERDEAQMRAALERGDVDWNDPKVWEAAKRMPKLAAELEALRQLESEVDVEAADLRAALEEARAQSPSKSDLLQLERVWPKKEPAMQPTVRRPAWLWLGGLVAAAALILLINRGYFESGSDDPGPALGTATDIELLAPAAQSDSIISFQWQTEVKIGDSFVVTVRDTETGETRTSERVSAAAWVPDPPLRAKTIQWFVTRYRGGASSGETSSAMEFSLPD